MVSLSVSVLELSKFGFETKINFGQTLLKTMHWSMEHFSIQEVRAADWANLKLARIEVNKQIFLALKAARFKSAQTVPLPPALPDWSVGSWVQKGLACLS